MIYTITTYAINHATGEPLPHGHRVFGWFPTYLQAVEAVSRNSGGMEECRYSQLVIEEVPSGIHATATVVQWFQWTDGGGWQHLNETPAWAAQVCNHSMG
jgi:hypothetical protein